MLDGGHERAPSKPLAIVHPEKGELEPAFCFTGLLQDLVPGPSQVALVVKNPPANAGNVRDLGSDPWVGKIPLEKEMATHSSFLAWRVPGTEEPSRLQRIGSHRIRHN